MSRVQLALNVADLDQAIGFYTKLFGTAPAKVRPGYANFAVANPPLKLILIAGDQTGIREHLGVVADRRLAAVEGYQQITGADLARGRDEAEEAEANRVGERSKRLGELVGLGLRQGSLEHRGAARFGSTTAHEDAPDHVLTVIDVSAMINVSTVANVPRRNHESSPAGAQRRRPR